MNLIAITLGLCLACGFTRSLPQANLTGPADVKSFCKVMQDPKLFQDRPITLQATANILAAGILLKSDECKVPAVSVHYWKDYEKGSDPEAVELLKSLRSNAYEAYLRGDDIKLGPARVTIMIEGKVARNSWYRMKRDRGSATVATWDYHYEYAFVVSRVVSLRRP